MQIKKSKLKWDVYDEVMLMFCYEILIVMKDVMHVILTKFFLAHF
jgi:hypothetical protein